MSQTPESSRKRRTAGFLVFVASTVVVTLVALAWWGLARAEPTPWSTVTVEGQTLVVDYLGGECDRSASLDVTEESQTVEVTVKVKGWALSCTDVAVPRQVRATLARPLGARAIVDGACAMDKYRLRPTCTDK